MRAHVQRVFACKIGTCTKKYPHAKSLREHKQTVHDNKTYICDVPGCNKILTLKRNLRRHKQSKHKDAKPGFLDAT